MSTEDDRIRISREHVAGTRDWLLQRIRTWKESSEKSVFWLQGVAGTGKSVMAAFAARKLEEENLLGASFFFKHNNQNRNNAGALINSIAYSLAAWNPQFGKALLLLRDTTPDIANGSLDIRFKRLIQEPFEQICNVVDQVVLIFDALDGKDLPSTSLSPDFSFFLSSTYRMYRHGQSGDTEHHQHSIPESSTLREVVCYQSSRTRCCFCFQASQM